MFYVKINETLYPATINGKTNDREWDNRESKAITLEMGYAEAAEIFIDGLLWSIVQQGEEVPVYETRTWTEPVLDENGEPVLDENGAPVTIEKSEAVQIGTEIPETEWDNSEYSIAGDIVDHRNGTVTVKMGKPTEIEILRKQLENAASSEEIEALRKQLENAVTEEELNAAYLEGVNSL